MPCCNSGSIQYGLGILQSIQNETKSLKKSLKVIGYPACNWFLCFQQLYRYLFFLRWNYCKTSSKSSFPSYFYVLHSDFSFLLGWPQDVVTENEFEKRLLADVIPPTDIGVTFDDIGALENVKDTLKELVMLPLQRPELFCKGQLTKVKSFICIEENKHLYVMFRVL